MATTDNVIGILDEHIQQHLSDYKLDDQALLSALLLNTPAPIAMLDKNMCYLAYSRRWITEFRLKADSLIGRSHYEVFPDIPRHWKLEHEKTLSGKIEKFEDEPYVRADGTVDWVRREYHPWFDSKNEVGGIIMFNEVTTERKKMEEELRMYREHLENEVRERTKSLIHANKELQDFANTVSHDLKNPLNIIGMCASVLSNSYQNNFDNTGKHLLKEISDTVIRMDEMINDLLSLARLKEKFSELKVIDVNEIIEQVKNNLNTGLSLKEGIINIKGRLPDVVGNEAIIKSLFQNLISNSFKFVAPGIKPFVSISGEDMGDEYYFTIDDNGIGIETEYENEVFDVFKRLKPEDYSGTGIGLAIVKKAVQLHKGKVWYESKPGCGTTFYFTISKNLKAD